MEITLREAAKITGKCYNTIMQYYSIDHPYGRLPTYRRGRRVYTTTEDLHIFLSKLPKRQIMNLPESYMTPVGYEPLFVPDPTPPEFGIPVVEVARILCVSQERIYILVRENKLELIKDEFDIPHITHSSLEIHLKRVETYFFTKKIEEARKEIYGDIITEAHREAQRQSRVRARTELRRANRRAKSGRPEGTKDKRRRRKAIRKFENLPDDYTLK